MLNDDDASGRKTVALSAFGCLHSNEERVSCGTTLVAVEFNGGVVCGTDSRTSVGSFIDNRTTDKITTVLENRVYVLRAGAAADTQAIADIVKYRLELIEMFEGEKVTVYRAAQVFRQYLYQYRDDLMGSVIVLGYDDKLGGQVYTIPMGGFTIRQRVGVSGSGSTFILGYIDGNWKPDMTAEQCENLVKNAVALAMLRDGSSGGVHRLGILEKNKWTKKLFRPDEGKFPVFPEPEAYPIWTDVYEEENDGTDTKI